MTLLTLKRLGSARQPGACLRRPPSLFHCQSYWNLNGGLRSLYRFSPSDFGRVLEHLFGLANVTVENWTLAAQALEAHLQGMDFADALHLACSAHCSAFVTFDRRRFASKAARLGLQPEVVLPGQR